MKRVRHAWRLRQVDDDGLPAFSLGPEENLGWMQYLGTTEHHEHAVLVLQDWRKVFLEALGAAESTSPEEQESVEELVQSADSLRNAI